MSRRSSTGPASTVVLPAIQDVPDAPPDPPLPPIQADRPRGLRVRAERPDTPVSAPPPAPAPAPSPAPTPPNQPPAPAPAVGDFRTRDLRGLNISRVNIAKQNYLVEVLDDQGRWASLFPIVGTGSKIFGREAGSTPESMKSLGARHVQFENTSRGLFVRPGSTLNGVYRRLRGPVELTDGLRVRIGHFILTFREAPAPEAAEVRVAEGEHLLARDLWALGHLEFLRPDGRPGVRFPLLNPARTILGRGGYDDQRREVHVDLPLPDDPEVSRRHARIDGRGGDSDRLTLHDLDSSTGTWVQLRERTQVEEGDEFLNGAIILRVVKSP